MKFAIILANGTLHSHVKNIRIIGSRGDYITRLFKCDVDTHRAPNKKLSEKHKSNITKEIIGRIVPLKLRLIFGIYERGEIIAGSFRTESESHKFLDTFASSSN